MRRSKKAVQKTKKTQEKESTRRAKFDKPLAASLTIFEVNEIHLWNL